MSEKLNLFLDQVLDLNDGLVLKNYTGNAKFNWNPVNKPLLLGFRNFVAVINPYFYSLFLRKAVLFVLKSSSDFAKSIFIYDENSFRLLKTYVLKLKHFATARYYPGLLSNFKSVFFELLKKNKDNELVVCNDQTFPDYVFLFQATRNYSYIFNECRRIHTPLVSVVNSSVNINFSSYGIFSNSAGYQTDNYYTIFFARIIKEGLSLSKFNYFNKKISVFVKNSFLFLLNYRGFNKTIQFSVLKKVVGDINLTESYFIDKPQGAALLAGVQYVKQKQLLLLKTELKGYMSDMETSFTKYLAEIEYLKYFYAETEQFKITKKIFKTKLKRFRIMRRLEYLELRKLRSLLREVEDHKNLLVLKIRNYPRYLRFIKFLKRCRYLLTFARLLKLNRIINVDNKYSIYHIKSSVYRLLEFLLIKQYLPKRKRVIKKFHHTKYYSNNNKNFGPKRPFNFTQTGFKNSNSQKIETRIKLNPEINVSNKDSKRFFSSVINKSKKNSNYNMFFKKEREDLNARIKFVDQSQIQEMSGTDKFKVRDIDKKNTFKFNKNVKGKPKFNRPWKVWRTSVSTKFIIHQRSKKLPLLPKEFFLKKLNFFKHLKFKNKFFRGDLLVDLLVKFRAMLDLNIRYLKNSINPELGISDVLVYFVDFGIITQYERLFYIKFFDHYLSSSYLNLNHSGLDYWKTCFYSFLIKTEGDRFKDSVNIRYVLNYVKDFHDKVLENFIGFGVEEQCFIFMLKLFDRKILYKEFDFFYQKVSIPLELLETKKKLNVLYKTLNTVTRLNTRRGRRIKEFTRPEYIIDRLKVDKLTGFGTNLIRCFHRNRCQNLRQSRLLQYKFGNQFYLDSHKIQSFL